MASPLRVGFVGAGSIAHIHAKHLSRIEGVQLAAATDPNESSLQKFAGAFPGVATFADHRAMLLESKLDAVCICSPNGAHCENALAAFDAGCHVMVEKPMAMNAGECERMIDAANRAKKELVVGFQFRFDPRTELIHRHVADGLFGKILYVRCQALRRRGIPNWGVFGRKELQGGGPLIDIGVHCLEMAHYAIGSPRPIAASGNCWTYYGDKPSSVVSLWPNWDYQTYTVEDLAVGMIRFENGTMLNIEASFVAHVEKDVWTFSLMGEKGGATWDPITVFTDQNGYMFNMTPGWLPPGGWDNDWDKKMRHFVDVVRDGRPNLSPGDHGLKVQKMLDAIYASSAKGMEVSIV